MQEPEPSGTSTMQLVRSAQDGDEAAFVALYHRMYPRLERIVRVRLGARLRALVDEEDVLAETFFQMLLRLPSYEERSDACFTDWMAAIAVNQIRKHAELWSRQKRDPARLVRIDDSSDEHVQRAHELTAKVASPASRAACDERSRRLEQALDQLEEPGREVILLRHFAGMEFAEIAGRLGRPSEAAARELYRRSRAKLAVVLRRYGVEEEP